MNIPSNAPTGPVLATVEFLEARIAAAALLRDPVAHTEVVGLRLQMLIARSHAARRTA